MIPWLKSLFTDEKAFFGMARAFFAGGGALVIAEPEMMSFLPQWAGAAMLAFSGLMRSSGKGQK